MLGSSANELTAIFEQYPSNILCTKKLSRIHALNFYIIKLQDKHTTKLRGFQRKNEFLLTYRFVFSQSLASSRVKELGMFSIVTSILSSAVGLFWNKVRDLTADKLKNGDVTDAKNCKIVGRELNDIKSKIDGLSSATLLASYDYQQEAKE